MTSVGVFG